MDCDEAKMKIQSLIDNELDEKEINNVLTHIESCYLCRTEYIELIRIQRILRGIKFPEPQKEWFETQHKHKPRKILLTASRVVIAFSSIIILSWFLDKIFIRNESTYFKLGLISLIVGLLIIFVIKVYDRIIELKHDKYGSIIK